MEEMTFEQAMSRLEEVVRMLESGSGTLDDMLKLYEEGMALHKTCEERLNAYEGRLKMLSAKESES